MREGAKTMDDAGVAPGVGVQSLIERPLLDRVLRGSAWAVGGAIVSRALALGAMIIVGRLLGSTDFGKLGMLQSTVGLFGLFAGTAMGMTATKYVAECRTKDRPGAGEYIALSVWLAAIAGLFSSAVLFLCSSWLATDVFHVPSMVRELRICTSLALFGVVGGAQTGALAGLEDFRMMAGVNAARGALLVVATTFGAYAAGLAGAVAGFAVAEAGSTGIGFAGLRLSCRRLAIPVVYRSINRMKIAAVWQFTLPLVLSSFVIQPALWASNLILANQPGGYAGLGLFNAADKYRQVLLFLPASLTPAVLSLLSNLHGSSQSRNFRTIFKATVWGSVGIVLVPAMILTGFSGPAMSVFGPDFAEGSTTLVLLAASTVLVALNNMLGQSLVSTGHVWRRFLLDVLLGGTLVGCAWWWVPSLSQNGLALAQCAAYAITGILLGFVVHRTMRITRNEDECPHDNS